MQINILSFGKLAEYIPSEKVDLDQISDTDAFKNYLELRYPQLSGTKYAIAVNQQIAGENVLLTDQCTIAVMPPFSGG